MMKKILGVVAVIGAVAGFFFLTAEDAPVGIVVPHHDMVAPIRQAYIKAVSEKVQPKTVVVLVPDHFNQSKEHIITTGQSWETIVGTIEADAEVISLLALPEFDKPFQSEHGLTILLKEIKEYFGSSRIVPVMMSRNATYSEVNAFVDSLYENCPSCFVMASVDFSHTNTANGAALHDELVLRELSRANPVELYKHAEVDSPEALTALVLWGSKHGAKRFNLFSHTNSGHLADRVTGEMTSHIIGGYERGLPELINDDVVTFMFGGDTMFARDVHSTFTETGVSPFAPLGERFFWGVDVAMVNLEGVFSEREDVEVEWEKIPPKLRFAPLYIEVLRASRISAVGFANNHTFDGDDTERAFTTQSLLSAGVVPVGYPRENSAVVIKEQGSTKVAIIGIAAHEPVEDIAQSVKKYSDEGYRVIAYIHFGDEYLLTHTKDQEEIAKRLIEAGADLIVGSHPHVVQDVSVYKNVPIIYSLGNFLFDQNFKTEVQVGAVAGVKISAESTEVFLIPVRNYTSVSLLSEEESRRYLEEWTKGWEGYETGFGQFRFPTSH